MKKKIAKNIVTEVFGKALKDPKLKGQLPDQETLREIAKDYFKRKIVGKR
jgi:hypothetical protein